MKVLEYAVFKQSLIELRRKGGQYDRAYKEALAIIEDLRNDPQKVKNKTTNHGENRIKKAVKYELGASRCRLVTVQDSGFIFLCFAGAHDDTDKWLDKNRGLTIRVDDCSKPIATYESIDIAEPEQRLHGEIGFCSKPLISLLEEHYQYALLDRLNWKLANQIAAAEVFISDDEILALVDQVADDNQKAAIHDVLVELRSDDIEGATRRARVYTGELKSVETAVKEESEPELMDSSDFQHIRVDSEHYRRLIEHYAQHADFKDWMLFMHPDQQLFVGADYNGPAKLSGVSGSGKTCVVVRRALALAEKYPGEKILILTLNRSLATLIQTLVEKAALNEVRDRIEVLPFFRVCQQLLNRFEPQSRRLYDDVTWKSKEHIDEIWREFYRCELNNTDAQVLHRLHDSLISRGIDAESYIREEFDWIRSATSPDNRVAYLKMERSGRTYPVDVSFRLDLLSGLAYWEKKMRFVGVTDYLGIANALYHHIEKIEPVYRCVLIDESQDFGTLDIRLIRRLVAENTNDVFLCGDAAQQVSSKHQNLIDAGMAVPGARSHKLSLNYRNSRQILEVAHGVLLDNLAEQMLDSKDFEILDPSYANFSGPTPLMLVADSHGQELAAALSYARSEAENNAKSKICVAICGYTEHELAAFASRVGLPVLSGETKLEDGQVFLSDLENTKGFEFQCMIVANCCSNTIPYPRAPQDETFRDLARLYVTMTRARQQLVVSYCGEPSRFLSGQSDRFMHDTWTNYTGNQRIDEVTPPHKLDQLRNEFPARDIMDMTGRDYLYLDHAIGCPSLLIEKLRAVITGKSRRVNRDAVEWKNIGEAVRDTAHMVGSRKFFGPEGYRLFRERFDSKISPR